MAPADSWLDPLRASLESSGLAPEAWAVAWARLLPTTLIVPAFGLRALPLPGRALFALLLAASIAPVATPPVGDERPWAWAFAEQALLGLPTALAAAAPLWAATMTGNLIDALRGDAGAAGPGPTESNATPLGQLLSLGACAAFLGLGGPAALAGALAWPTPPPLDLNAMSVALVQGIHVAVLLAAPLLAVSIFLDAVQGISLRLHGPSGLVGTLAPIRSLALLAVAASLLDRLFDALVGWMLAGL